jgi:hypothetical protein
LAQKGLRQPESTRETSNWLISSRLSRRPCRFIRPKSTRAIWNRSCGTLRRERIAASLPRGLGVPMAVTDGCVNRYWQCVWLGRRRVLNFARKSQRQPRSRTDGALGRAASPCPWPWTTPKSTFRISDVCDQAAELNGIVPFQRVAQQSIESLAQLISSLVADQQTPFQIPKLTQIENGLGNAGARKFVDEIRTRKPDAKSWSPMFTHAWLSSTLDSVSHSARRVSFTPSCLPVSVLKSAA